MPVNRMTVATGDELEFDADGRHEYVRRYGMVRVKKGDLFVVTSKAEGRLWGRHQGQSYVIAVEYGQVSYPSRSLGEVPEGMIDPEDPRLQWLWEDAGKLATRLDLCSDYDRLTEALGIPGRMRVWTIEFESVDGVQLTAKVEARSKRQAAEKLRAMQSQPPVRDVRAIGR